MFRRARWSQRSPSCGITGHWRTSAAPRPPSGRGSPCTEPAGDRRSGGAGVSLSRRRGSLAALAHHQRRDVPQPAQLSGRREAQGRRGPRAGPGADADHRRRARAAISRESREDRDPDSAAGAADRQSPGDVVGADERGGRRVAHRVRQHREPPAGAGRGQDARDRAPRRARRRPGPCAPATAHRELCARGGGQRWPASPARVRARAGTRRVVTRQPVRSRRRADGHDRRPVRARALAGVDGALRARAGAPDLATRPVGSAEAGRLQGDGVDGGAPGSARRWS